MANKDNSDEIKSPIIMKVDAPPEDSIETDENCVNEQKVNETSRNSFIPKPSKVPVLAKPKLFGATTMSNPFASSVILSNPKLNFGNNTPKPLLRPSKLSQASVCEANNSSPKKTFALTPSQLNPFGKVTSSTSEIPEEEQPSESSTSPKQEECSSSSDDKTVPKAVDPPKFVPLTVENSTSSTSSNNFQTATPSFVFGQNLHERVVGEAVEGNGIDSTSAIPSSSTAACSNGSSSDNESLFGNAAASDKSLPTSTTDGKSLSEAAREYEESRAQKRKYEEVQVVTGEENEQNVMQIGCKLFAFDQTTRNWQERGRGNLRLNDIQMDENDGEAASSSNSVKVTQSRLVVRSTGSLRVVLNTKIWSGMSVELASPKSIRLTAMDSQGVVKVFLVMANVKEIEKLHELLSRRVENEIKRVETDERSSKRIAIDSENV